MRLTQSFGGWLLASMLALAASSVPAFAEKGPKHQKKEGQEKHEGSGHKKHDNGKAGHDVARAGSRDIVVIDTDGHRRTIHEYYANPSLPPGRAKRDSLPPGLRKQLRERGQLPPGLQKRLTPVPTALSGRLPTVPPYYTRYFGGRDLVIVDTRTNRIVSVLRDVVP